MNSNSRFPSLLLAACTLLPCTSAAGEPIELVFNGQIDSIYNYGTLPCPVCYWEIGDPYVISIVFDPRSQPTEYGHQYRVHEASITIRGQTFMTWSADFLIGGDQYYDSINVDGWIPYEWDNEGQVALSLLAILPRGSTTGISDFTCSTFAQLLNTATIISGGVYRPDDEGASGPYTLTSCQSVPCQPWHCPADFNCDGGVDGTDVQAFFEKWEAGNSEADISRDGATGPYDVELFFLLWESNECSLPPPP